MERVLSLTGGWETTAGRGRTWLRDPGREPEWLPLPFPVSCAASQGTVPWSRCPAPEAGGAAHPPRPHPRAAAGLPQNHLPLPL